MSKSPLSYEHCIGVSPAIVDAHYFFDDSSSWRAAMDYCGLGESQWAEVDDTLPPNYAYVLGHLASRTSMNAGSSLLAAMAVMPEQVKHSSVLYATDAYSADGVRDTASSFFHTESERLGVATRKIHCTGNNPIVHVIVDPSSGERSFLKESGVSKQITALPNIDESLHQSGLLLVDAYELVSGKTATTLSAAVDGASGNVALSLGSASILEAALAKQIRSWAGKGKLAFLFGNEAEFLTLSQMPMGDNMEIPLKAELAQLPTDMTVVVTRGEHGLMAKIGEKIYEVPASPIPDGSIVSKSGAGDAVMGMVLGAALAHNSLPEALEHAVEHASRVIASPHDIVLPKKL